MTGSASYSDANGNQIFPSAAYVVLGGVAYPVSPSTPLSFADAYMPPATVTFTSATTINTAVTVTTAGMDTVIITLVPTGTITAGAISFQAYDGYNWVTIKAPRTDSYSTDAIFALTGNPGIHSWQLPVAGYPQVRALLSTAIVGAGTCQIVTIVSSAPDVSLVTVGNDPAATAPPIGSGSIATAQTTISTSALLIAAARVGSAGVGSGATGVGRITITVSNSGTNTVFIGPSGVTATTGLPVAAGASVTIATTAAIYAIAATGSNAVGVLEIF